MSLSGAGLSGPGQVDLALTHGQPGGGVLYFFCPTALVAPNESAYSLGGAAPLFTDLDLANLGVFGGILGLDGVGSSLFSFQNPGGLEGQLQVQGLLFDPSLGLMLGTTNSTPF